MFDLPDLPRVVLLLILLIIGAWGVAYAFPALVVPLKIKLGLSEALINTFASFFYVFCMVGIFITPVIKLLLPGTVGLALLAAFFSSGYGIVGLLMIVDHVGHVVGKVLSGVAFSFIGFSTGLLYSHTYALGVVMIKEPRDQAKFSGLLNVLYGIGGVVAISVTTNVKTTTATTMGVVMLAIWGMQVATGVIFAIFTPIALKRTKTGNQASVQHDHIAGPDTPHNQSESNKKTGWATFVTFLKYPSNWFVIVIYFLKLALGATLTVNTEPILKSVGSTKTNIILPAFMAIQLLGRTIMLFLFLLAPQPQPDDAREILLHKDKSQNQRVPYVRFILLLNGVLGSLYAVLFFLCAVFVENTSAIEIILLGFALVYGMFWPLDPELLKCGVSKSLHDASAWQIEAMATLPWGGIGAVVLGYVTGAIYDLHASTDSTGARVCVGKNCFHQTFIILGTLGAAYVVATLAVFLLGHARPRR
eukprot:comp15921_c0_seq1/m.24843 comp15921_c0_seq1/g.24843  ORF comp15921_c0_seq1/g.24843 comp15921_c0_seq1/m.24843 type:complete len:475 (+) comp15921_c0_seq1:3-1427(+)